MDRSWVLWIGAALTGNLVGTIGLVILGGNPNSLLMTPVIALGFVPFTLGGSALFLIVFEFLKPRRTAVRYAVVLAAGLVAGALIVILFRTVVALVVGAGFGFVTAVAWVTLHKLLYGADEHH